MDFQRILFLTGIGIIAYMIVLQWNQDYNPATVAPTQVTSVSAYDQPEVSVDFTASINDTPTTQTEPIDPTSISANTQSTSAGKLITVRTDTLAVTIDTRGGDIIHVDLLKHLAQMDHPDVPFTLLEQNNSRTYVAQSGLVWRTGADRTKRLLFSTDQDNYTLPAGDDRLDVVLRFNDAAGTIINKVYTFTNDSHLIDLNYQIENNTNQAWNGNFYAQLKRDRSPDPTASTSLGMSAYLGPAFSLNDEKYQRYDFDDIDSGELKVSAQGGWAAMLQHYFVSAWVPDPEQTYHYRARRNNGNYLAGFVSQPIQIQPHQAASTGARLYVGPKLQGDLEAISPNLDLVVDYGFLWWIAQPLFWLLTAMHGFVGNWGVAIILVTLCVKLFFFYPSAISYRSMAKMRTLAPEIAKLKERFGDDRQKMSQGMMELYKREKANPLSGCFPILIQMPVFIGLYWMLMESVELRHAPFMLWITDLSVQDPYYVLPLLMGGTMFIQQMLNPTPPDPMQAKIMKMLPIVFTFFFLWFPAGLVVYWVANNILSILQQYVITKRIEREMAAKRH